MSNIGATLRKLCAAFNAHDLDKIMPFFADDCILELPRGREPWGTRYEGKEDVRKGLATRFEGLPDVHYGNEQHFVDEEKNTGIKQHKVHTGWYECGDAHKKEPRLCDGRISH